MRVFRTVLRRYLRFFRYLHLGKGPRCPGIVGTKRSALLKARSKPENELFAGQSDYNSIQQILCNFIAKAICSIDACFA